MSSGKYLNISCDRYVLDMLEGETAAINHINHQIGFSRILVADTVREILVDWAVEKQSAKHRSQAMPVNPKVLPA